jgi:hypothetical protein
MMRAGLSVLGFVEAVGDVMGERAYAPERNSPAS